MFGRFVFALKVLIGQQIAGTSQSKSSELVGLRREKVGVTL